MKIAIGADHSGYKLKEELMPFIEKELGIDIIDDGAYEFDESDDYPDFIIPVARSVSKDPDEIRGIVIGYSGQGEAMVANRFPHVRAMVFYGNKEPMANISKFGEPINIIQASRIDNDSNILSIGAGFVSLEEAKEAIKIWLKTPFKGLERHARRIAKIESHKEKHEQ